MKLERMVRTLPVAVAVQAGQLPPAFQVARGLPATDLHAEARGVADAAGTEEAVLLQAPTAIVNDEFVLNLKLHGGSESWEAEYQDLYVRLVEKEAVGTITGLELRELDGLQRIRRRLVSPASVAEIIARHRREKLDQELTSVLQRYVRLAPLSKNQA